ncbi:MAG: peptidyl-prolyl cis-trans isomerase [Armatimonadetes bacterium]|nr:peptidyl-prolyl cis-trans isomerase [Armatimonadota bacterium]
MVINRLIEEKLLLQVAREQGVYPTDAEVNALYKEKSDDIKDFEKNYSDAGVSRKYVENQLRLELAQFKLQTKSINLTDMEVEKHYKENPSRFTIGKRIKLSVIAVPDFKKDEVDKALGSGKVFSDVAKTLSTDTTAKDGGNLGYIFDLDLSEQIKAALKDVRIGGLTPWIKGDQVQLRFHLDDIIPEQLKPLDAKMKRDLRRSLMMDKGVAKNDVEALLKDARKKAKIDVKQLQFKSEIQRMLERYKIGG